MEEDLLFPIEYTCMVSSDDEGRMLSEEFYAPDDHIISAINVARETPERTDAIIHHLNEAQSLVEEYYPELVWLDRDTHFDKVRTRIRESTHPERVEIMHDFLDLMMEERAEIDITP